VVEEEIAFAASTASEVTPVVLDICVDVPAIAVRAVVEINTDERSVPSAIECLVAAFVIVKAAVTAYTIEVQTVKIELNALFIEGITDDGCYDCCAVAEVERIPDRCAYAVDVLVIDDSAFVILNAEYETFIFVTITTELDGGLSLVFPIQDPTPIGVGADVEVAAEGCASIDPDLEDIELFKSVVRHNQRIFRWKTKFPADVVASVASLKIDLADSCIGGGKRSCYQACHE
jgi:hypothetical protein